jgi:hypothetical protein
MPKPDWLLYTLLFLVQLPLYVFTIACFFGAIVATRRRKRSLALALATLAVAPFVGYYYSFIEEKYRTPTARKSEVASWPHVSIGRENKPQIFFTTMAYGGSISKRLVELGRFGKAYGLVGDDWYSFERARDPACIEYRYDDRKPRARDPLQPTGVHPLEPSPCVSVTRVGRRFDLTPQIAEAHLRLLDDRSAPSHRESEGITFASSTLELRLVWEQGDQLVSFWEAPYFKVPTFPPTMVGANGWVREWFEAEHAPRPNPVNFVLDALSDAG